MVAARAVKKWNDLKEPPAPDTFDFILDPNWEEKCRSSGGLPERCPQMHELEEIGKPAAFERNPALDRQAQIEFDLSVGKRKMSEEMRIDRTYMSPPRKGCVRT